MGRGLSEQQRTALRRIGDELIALEQDCEPDDYESLFDIRLRGAKCRAHARTESGRVSWARTLRRLQDRGLIVRRGQVGGDWPTEAGWEIYRQLTGRDVPAGLTKTLQ
jgi:hypothetical protein